MADKTMDMIEEEIEEELLLEIISNLTHETMTEEQAQSYAREFLTLLPIQDKHELLEKLRAFSKTNPAAKGLYLKFGGPIEEEERQKKLKLMSKHIKNGQIDHALNVAKGGTNG